MGHRALSPDYDGLHYYLEQARKYAYEEARELLRRECAAYKRYNDAWQVAVRKYTEKRKEKPSLPWNVMKKEYFVAVICYTLEAPYICRDFNKRCRSAKPDASSWHSFPFKSLLYFLMGAFCRLPPFRAPQLFRGVDKFTHEKNKVAFPQFLSASVSSKQASKFGGGSYLLVLRNVPESLIRDISVYSIYPRHREVLIWPFCVFTLAEEQDSTKVLVFDTNTSWTLESELRNETPQLTEATLFAPTKAAPAERPAHVPSRNELIVDAASVKRPRIHKTGRGAHCLDAQSVKRAKTDPAIAPDRCKKSKLSADHPRGFYESQPARPPLDTAVGDADARRTEPPKNAEQGGRYTPNTSCSKSAEPGFGAAANVREMPRWVRQVPLRDVVPPFVSIPAAPPPLLAAVRTPLSPRVSPMRGAIYPTSRECVVSVPRDIGAAHSGCPASADRNRRDAAAEEVTGRANDSTDSARSDCVIAIPRGSPDAPSVGTAPANADRRRVSGDDIVSGASRLTALAVGRVRALFRENSSRYAPVCVDDNGGGDKKWKTTVVAISISLITVAGVIMLWHFLASPV